VSSTPMDLDIEVRRRDGKYLLIARQYGVLVKATDIQAGLDELERRTAIITNDLEEVGIPVRAGASPNRHTEPPLRDRLAPSLVIIVTVGAMLASFILLATAPIVNALAGIRSGVSDLARLDGSQSIAAVGRTGVDFVIKLSQTLDQVTPERREELRTAVRKIALEVASLVEDARPPQPPSPGRPNDTTK
jgi:hypothetical protein